MINMSITTPFTLQVLPEHLQEDIVNRLEDAVDIARAKCVCKSLRDVADHVQSLRIICKEEYHASVRNEIPTIVIPRVDGKSKASTSKAVIGGTATGRDHQAATPRSRATQPHEADHQVDSNRGSFPNSQSSKKHKFEGEFHPVIEEHQPQIAAAAAGGETTAITSSGASSNNNKVEPIFFRHLVPEILRKTKCIVRLWIEIDPKLQSKKVADGERVFTDHWLTDPLKVNKWIPSVQATLQDLCIVDYGQQAISRPSSLLAILSQTCLNLKTLDLRHMFLGTKDCKDMPQLTSLSLHWVKVDPADNVLQEINKRMMNLQTLAMLRVVGVEQGHLTLAKLKILCLGLTNKAKSVRIELPNLVTLQLKMKCPEVLQVQAPALKHIAFNLEILDSSLVGFEKIHDLQDVLYGASNFTTLSKLVRRNRLVTKTFLDIPCMSASEDGERWRVLKQVLLNIPPFETLHSECPNMQVLNVGPGLWHSMETAHYSSLMEVPAWPPNIITRLILHMIPQKLAESVDIVLLFVKGMPKLQVLEVKVQKNSPVDYDTFINAIKSHVTHLNFRPGKWTGSLDFSCFRF
ncbi:hypothetical protein BDL97_09G072200 [Sphagnum fallax]|nr:hypothetical protein BDL97_09G072200 [Sphagnum fallax]